MDPEVWNVHNVESESVELKTYNLRGPTANQRGVILLAAGLGNTVALFNLLGGDSLPSFLQNKGFDVWAIEFRGHGESSRPESKKGWSMSDYAFKDAVAVIEHILKESKSSVVHWVGHSMGGMIGLALASHPFTATKLSSVTTLASSIFLHHSIWWWVYNCTPLFNIMTCMGGIDMGFHTRLSSRVLSVCCCPPCGLLDIVADLKNTGRVNSAKLMRQNFGYESANVFRDLATGFLKDGLRLELPDVLLNTDAGFREGKQLLLCEQVGRCSPHIHMIYGTEDKQVAVDDVLKTFSIVSANSNGMKLPPRTRLTAVGLRGGTTLPYSHFDLVTGKDASKDVFPKLMNFFEDIYDEVHTSSVEIELV